MTPAELRAHCQRQIELLGSETAHITLVIPGEAPRSGKKRLAGRRGGPLGEAVAWTEQGTACVFRAPEVLAWLDRQEERGPTPRERRRDRLSVAIYRLANLIDGGHLMAATNPTDLLEAVAAELETMQAEREAWRTSQAETP